MRDDGGPTLNEPQWSYTIFAQSKRRGGEYDCPGNEPEETLTALQRLLPGRRGGNLAPFLCLR